MTYSKTLCIFLTDSTGDSTISTKAFSSSAALFVLLVTKCEFTSPLSYSTPSTNSTEVSLSSVGSITTTPVKSTNLKASPIILPNSGSLLVDIVAT